MKQPRKASVKISRTNVEIDPLGTESVPARPAGHGDRRAGSGKLLSRAALETARAGAAKVAARPSREFEARGGRKISTATTHNNAAEKCGRAGYSSPARSASSRTIPLPAGLTRRKLKSLPLAKLTPYGCKLFGRHVEIATRGLALLAEGHSLNQAAHAQGAPVVTLFRLLHAYATGGIWALLPGKSTGRKSLITTLGITPAEISQLAELAKQEGSIPAACRAMAKMLGTRPELAAHLRRGDRIARSIPAAIHRQLNPKRTALTGRQPRYGP